MKRTAVARVHPRTARQTQWLRSVLAHHHRPDPRADNEIIVLATGMDQYLQEVFHHLAYPNQDDTVRAEDFRALCAALGLPGTEGQKAPEPGGHGDMERSDEDLRDACLGLPEQLTFKDFHARLCGVFRVRSARSGSRECAWRLPVSEETELVERQIRLRCPRVRRRKCVSFDVTRDQSRTPVEPVSDEVAALRELVEDLRSALQGSDARCLALEVALRRGQGSTSPSSSNNPVQGNVEPPDRAEGQPDGVETIRTRRAQNRWDVRDPVLRELKLIRSSRDGQLDEAISFSRRLEEELQWAYQEVCKLQGLESSLRKENSQIRKRAEEAREALRLGLQRVRLIQEQAQSVPQLQSRITQLEDELLQCRSCCTCLAVSPAQLNHSEDSCSNPDAECLQRAVEGRAASDEEEEDREMKMCCPLEGKRSKSHVCGKRYQNDADNHPVYDKRHSSRDMCSWTGPNQEKASENRVSGRGQRPQEKEDRMMLQKTEKRRLSMLEDKLKDSLSLLLQLRTKGVSHRLLEKMVMDSLDVCRTSGPGSQDGSAG